MIACGLIMRWTSTGSSLVPSSTILLFLRSQLKSPCAKSTSLRPLSSSARSALRQDQHVARTWKRHGLEQQCRIRPRRDHTFSTGAARRQPREIAHRSTTTSRWHLRRAIGAASDGFGLSTSAKTRAKADAGALSFLDDPTGLAGPRLTKPQPDQRLRCTEFDAAGNVTVVNGEFRKSELIQKYGLQPRDLRKIDSSLLPTILVRPRAILLNLLHIRCLIQADRVLVFDIYGSTDSYTQSLFMYDLEGKLSLRGISSSSSSATSGQYHQQHQAHLPYEFRALEAVLISVTTALEGEFEGVRGPVVKVLRELEENIDRDKLRMLLVLSKKIGTFEQRARLVRDAIDELLEADDDLAAMYLTEKKTGTERDDEDHTEIEMLLESYDKVCDEIVQASGNLVANIRNTEEIVKAILDANRNSLMLLDLKFSIGTLGIGAGTFIAALYGMNLKSFIEEWDLGFPLVSLTCAVFTVVACVYGFRKLRKVQRLSMWGESDVDAMHAGDLGGSGGGGSRWRGYARGGMARDCADGSGGGVAGGAGRDEWRQLQHVTERIDGLEKNQWAAAIRLRKLRLAEREVVTAASSSASSTAAATARNAAAKSGKKT